MSLMNFSFSLSFENSAVSHRLAPKASVTCRQQAPKLGPPGESVAAYLRYWELVAAYKERLYIARSLTGAASTSTAFLPHSSFFFCSAFSIPAGKGMPPAPIIPITAGSPHLSFSMAAAVACLLTKKACNGKHCAQLQDATFQEIFLQIYLSASSALTAPSDWTVLGDPPVFSSTGTLWHRVACAHQSEQPSAAVRLKPPLQARHRTPSCAFAAAPPPRAARLPLPTLHSFCCAAPLVTSNAAHCASGCACADQNRPRGHTPHYALHCCSLTPKILFRQVCSCHDCRT